MKDYSYKEYAIPKNNGKVRKIVAPSMDLLAYQRSRLPLLEEIYNQEVFATSIENTAHGFIPQKNCVTAAKEHIGFKSTVIMDLSNFFDTVTRDMFKEYPEIHIDNHLFHKQGYCAQGFATSPLLANIALIPLMKKMDYYLSAMFTKYSFTIYADDIQISTNLLNSRMIKDLIIDPITQLVETNGFFMNPNKTRIRYAEYGYRKILGLNVGDKELKATRKTMRKIRAARHQKNGSSLGGLVTWSRCYPPKQRIEPATRT